MKEMIEIVERSLEKNGNMMEPTLDEVFKEVIGNPKLCRDVFGDVLRRALVGVIQQIYSKQRDAITKAPDSAICGDPGPVIDTIVTNRSTVPSKPSKSYLSGLQIAYQRSLLDFTLAGGKLLKNAVKADIERQYQIYRNQAATEVINAIWMRFILRDLPDDRTTVGAVIDDFKMKNLWNQAKKDLNRKLPEVANG